MTKEKETKKSTKKIIAILFIVLLPVLSLGLGFFGVQLIMGGSEDLTESKATETTSTKALIEKESVEESSNEKTEETLEKGVSTEVEKKHLLAYQMPSISTFNIQIGSYNELVNANKMIKNVNNQGFGAYVYKSDVYKVFIMSFLDRSNAEVNKVISEQSFDGAYITEVVLQPKEILYSEEDEKYIYELKQSVNLITEILGSYTKYVHTFQLSSFDQDDFRVYLITQHNEITKLKDRIASEEVSDNLKEQKTNFISYLEGLEQVFEKNMNIDNPIEKEIWQEMLEIIFEYPNLG